MITTLKSPPKAKGIHRSGAPIGQPLDDFRHDLTTELTHSLERALRRHKAETIAAAVNRKRSTIYRWAAKPGDIPASALPALADFDPDPEFLARVAAHLLARVSEHAAKRHAMGHTLMVIHELGPGRWGRTS